MLATMVLTTRKGAFPGSGNAPLFVLRHRLRRIRSGYPSAGRVPALPACVWPEKRRFSTALWRSQFLGFWLVKTTGCWVSSRVL
jgi:hypothetical protein